MKKVPQHIAIILDGNGRWASKKEMNRTQGHIEGVKRVEEILDESVKLGIKYLTLYTFSTENWSRPDNEVKFIMNILATVLSLKLKKLQRQKIRFTMVGRRDNVPENIMKAIDHVSEATKENDALQVNLAFNYGGRLEILDAVQKIVDGVQSGEFSRNDINEELLSNCLYTKDIPDPDLLIRTSGEKRISNFLLWQLSYAEFYFTDKFWPEFTVEEFHRALDDYQSRDRRYGAIGEVTA